MVRLKTILSRYIVLSIPGMIVCAMIATIVLMISTFEAENPVDWVCYDRDQKSGECLKYPGHVRMLGPDSVVIYREFRIKRDATFWVQREIVSVTDGIDTKIRLPDSEVVYDEGDFKVRRIVDTPVIPLGKYAFKSRVCWRASILQQRCEPAPTLILVVNGA